MTVAARELAVISDQVSPAITLPVAAVSKLGFGCFHRREPKNDGFFSLRPDPHRCMWVVSILHFLIKDLP